MAFKASYELSEVVLYAALITAMVHCWHNFFVCRGVGLVEHWGEIGSYDGLLGLIRFHLLISLDLLHNVLS